MRQAFAELHENRINLILGRGQVNTHTSLVIFKLTPLPHHFDYQRVKRFAFFLRKFLEMIHQLFACFNGSDLCCNHVSNV